MDEEAYDQVRTRFPEGAIPRAIPPDPAVFTQLGPLPHARIEASLCLAALLHRTAQWVQQQIETGQPNLEELPPEAEAVASPFDSPLPAPRPWKPKKRKWKY